MLLGLVLKVGTFRPGSRSPKRARGPPPQNRSPTICGESGTTPCGVAGLAAGPQRGNARASRRIVRGRIRFGASGFVGPRPCGAIEKIAIKAAGIGVHLRPPPSGPTPGETATSHS